MSAPASEGNGGLQAISLAGDGALSSDGARILEVLSGLVEPLWRSLPTTSEVVLHEVGLLPNSVVAIAGQVTGRQVGDPATDLLLEQLRNVEAEQNKIDYQSVLPDGRRLRSSTMIVRDSDGTPVAALCINTDISAWLESRQAIEAMVVGRSAADRTAQARRTHDVRLESQLGDAVDGMSAAARSDAPLARRNPAEGAERFPRSVDELVSQLIDSAIASVDVPVELMRKSHKLIVVEQLESRGLFLLKDAVELIAAALGVTRFTIYNYLNELGTTERQS